MSKPKEVLIKAVNTFLLERLQDEGFIFYEKSTNFKKKNHNNFTYEINFLGSRTNWLEEFVNFQVQYLIYVPKYKSWHKNNFQSQPLIGGGYVNGDRKAISQRSEHNHYGFGYDFVKFKPENIMNEIWENYVNYGKKYFESASDWQKVFQFADWNEIKIGSLIFQNRIEDALLFTENIMDEVLKPNDEPEHIQLQLKAHYEVYKSRFEYLKMKTSYNNAR